MHSTKSSNHGLESFTLPRLVTGLVIIRSANHIAAFFQALTTGNQTVPEFLLPRLLQAANAAFTITVNVSDELGLLTTPPRVADFVAALVDANHVADLDGRSGRSGRRVLFCQWKVKEEEVKGQGSTLFYSR